MKAVIMAGGSGTRLLPLTESTPKPLIKLCGKPVCCYILDLLYRHGCKEAVFTLRYKGEAIESFFSEKSYKNIKLDFSYEDKPLGTAGCVKLAAENFSEPFAVISGDAMCSFNLSSAMTFHKKHNAAVTIITKRTDDPREYGLVTSEKGQVTGFCEKPSYIGCLDNMANTGVYIISPSVLEIIPENSFSDFACDIFPEMLKKHMKIMAYEETGYWCDIGDIPAYKRCQRDLMDGRTGHKPDVRKITEYGYSDSGTGSYANLRAPYCIGKNVTIGENTVIGAGTVIGSNVTIGDDCEIEGAVLLDGCHIQSDVKLCDCIICSDAGIKRGSAVYENAVIGERAVLGKGCIVMPSVKISSGKQTGDNITVRSNIDSGFSGSFELSENGYSGETAIAAEPGLMARLGAAASSVTEKTIAVAHKGDDASRTFAESIMNGINSGGKNCADCGNVPLSVLIHKGRLLNAGLLIYVSASALTSVFIYRNGGMPILRAEERAIESIMNKGGVPRASFDRFGSKVQFFDGGACYRAMLERNADFKCNYSIRTDCNNRTLKKYAEEVFRNVGSDKGESLIVTLSTDGTSAELFSAGTDIISHEKLILINCLDVMEKGMEVSLPYNLLFDFEQFAEGWRSDIYRYKTCSCDNSDIKARKIAQDEAFLHDGCIAALGALSYAAAHKISLKELIKTLPDYKSRKMYVPLGSVSSLPVLKALSASGKKSEEGVMLEKDEGKILVRSDRRGKGLYLFARSLKAETADELCNFTKSEIERILSDK